MESQNSFVAHVIDMLRPLGEVSARAMFGGWGIYCNAQIFGLIVDEQLYLKGDGQTKAEYEAAEMAPFVYDNAKSGKRVAMSYFAATAEAMDDPRALLQWAKKALAAAERSAGAKKPTKQSESKGAPLPSKESSKKENLPAKGASKKGSLSTKGAIRKKAP